MLHRGLERLNNEDRKETDILEKTVGNFGRWQLKISLLMALLKLPIAWFPLSIVFLAPPTLFWCKPPTDLQTLSSDEWLDVYKNQNISMLTEGLNNGYCTIPEYMDHNSTAYCAYGYAYNKTTFTTSIVSEWDLVCDKKRLVDTSQMFLMLGILIGNLLFGILADKYGRKQILIICIIVQTGFGMATAWIPCYWGFVFTRFCLAIANGGIVVTSFVMCMEIVGGSYRTIVPILYQIPFGFGNSLMAGISYYFREWRDLHFILALLSSVYIVYLWIVPESPRWLLAVGRKDTALAVLHRAARMNKIDPKVINSIVLDDIYVQLDKKSGHKTSLWHSSTIRKRTFLLSINWLLAGLVFYGFSQYFGRVTENLHLTVALSGFIALPGTLLCVYIIRSYGRRYTIAASLLLSGASFLGLLAINFTPYANYEWPRLGLAAMAIVGLSISMPALYLFTGELYPTIVRNAGVGVALMFSRVGSMAAPFIIALEDISGYVPLLLLSIFVISQAFLLFLLPETKEKSLPEVTLVPSGEEDCSRIDIKNTDLDDEVIETELAEL